MNRNLISTLLMSALLGAFSTEPVRPANRTRRSNSKHTSKCFHGERNPAGSKMARLAAERRLGMPSGRPV